jgi:hypothetical protein
VTQKDLLFKRIITFAGRVVCQVVKHLHSKLVGHEFKPQHGKTKQKKPKNDNNKKTPKN